VLDRWSRVPADVPARAEVSLHEVAERFLAIARQRLLLNDWDGAGLFGRQAKECAERVALEKGTTPFVPDQRDPS
jgi:hypothetical protein